MAQELTVYEVLEVAENMERNAAKFYRKAAGISDDPRVSKLFADLAQWEKQHIRVFAEMKDRLSERAWEPEHPESGGVDVSELQIPSPAVFGQYADPSRELTGRENKADVLKMAIGKEKDTIAYYTSLKEFVLGEDNIRAIKNVIEEENKHVRILTQSLEQAGR